MVMIIMTVMAILIIFMKIDLKKHKTHSLTVHDGNRRANYIRFLMIYRSCTENCLKHWGNVSCWKPASPFSFLTKWRKWGARNFPCVNFLLDVLLHGIKCSHQARPGGGHLKYSSFLKWKFIFKVDNSCVTTACDMYLSGRLLKNNVFWCCLSLV